MDVRKFQKSKLTLDNLNKPFTEIERKCLWLYGEGNCGKTTVVKRNYNKILYEKDFTTNYWNGYEGEKLVLVDDFRDEYIKDYVRDMKSVWKQWTETFCFLASTEDNINIYPRYQVIIFISNKSIGEVFKNDEYIKKRFEEKFSQFHFKSPDDYERAVKWLSAYILNDQN